MTSKAEWQRRAKEAEEHVGSLLEDRADLQREIQRMTQEIERLADDNAVHEEMAKRWRMVTDIMRPRNGVFSVTWDPRDLDEHENREMTELVANATQHHRRIVLRHSLREFEEFARGVEETHEFEEDNDGEDR